MTAALVLAAVLAAGCVVLVALPFLRDPEPTADRLDAVDAATRQRLGLAEERDRALEALRELEADHRAGKVDDADYRTAVTRLRQEAAQALRALDAGQERPAGEGR